MSVHLRSSWVSPDNRYRELQGRIDRFEPASDARNDGTRRVRITVMNDVS